MVRAGTLSTGAWERRAHGCVSGEKRALRPVRFRTGALDVWRPPESMVAVELRGVWREAFVILLISNELEIVFGKAVEDGQNGACIMKRRLPVLAMLPVLVAAAC
ncbi:MAG: hypothetical protein NVS3B10_03820 [Polyangiales bacterium]